MMDDIRNSIDFFIRQKTRFSRKNYSKQTRRDYLENLYMLDILDKYFHIEYKNNAKIVDIGCKNWVYAKGEHAFFKQYCKDFSLYGVEIDAYRLYSNFYSRYEAAKFNIKNLPDTEYIADDFLNIHEKYDYIIWMLPFVFKKPHVRWGLPLRYYKPIELLAHAFNSLNNGGKMFIVNQGEDEFEEQKAMLTSLNIEFESTGEIQSDFMTYKHKRYGLVVSK